MRQNNLYIAICGSSGSGKTTLAKELAAHYEAIGISSQIISLDDFYKDGLANDPNVNWDDPSTFDHEVFLAFLKTLQENGAAESPIYDFVTSSRMKETKTISRVKVNIVEGIFSHHAAIAPLFHAKIFVDTNLDLCLARRRERDMRERGRTEVEVNAAWHQNVLPKYYEFIDPCKETAHVLVENSQSMTGRSVPQFDVRPVVQHLDQLLHSIDIANTRLSQMRCTLLPKLDSTRNTAANSVLPSVAPNFQ